MHWRLRRAEAGDAPAVSLVAAASFLETFVGVMPADDIVAHLAAKSAPAHFAAWIADPASVVTIATHPDTGTPVGYTVLTAPDEVGEARSDDIELRRIYTLSPTRGTGLGAVLMAQAIADATAMHRRRILLGVFARNTRACAFYERQGFRVAAERKFKVGGSLYDDFVYARDL